MRKAKTRPRDRSPKPGGKESPAKIRLQAPPEPKQETISLCRELRKIEYWTVRVMAERSNPAIVTKYIFLARGKTASAAMGQARKRLTGVMKSDPVLKDHLLSDRAEALTLELVARTEKRDPTQMIKSIYWLDDPTKPVGHPRQRIAEAAALKKAGWDWQRIYEQFAVPKENRRRKAGLRGETSPTQRAVFRSRVKSALGRKRRKYAGVIQRLKKLLSGPFPYLYEVTIKFLAPGQERPRAFAHRSILPRLLAHVVRLPISPTGGA